MFVNQDNYDNRDDDDDINTAEMPVDDLVKM